MSKADLTEVMWDRLAEAMAEKLADVDGSPENVQVVATALLAMAARSAHLAGLDDAQFARASQFAFVGGKEVLAMEEAAPALRKRWLTTLGTSFGRGQA